MELSRGLDELRLQERLLEAAGYLGAAFVLLVDLLYQGSRLSVPSPPLFAASCSAAIYQKPNHCQSQDPYGCKHPLDPCLLVNAVPYVAGV